MIIIIHYYYYFFVILYINIVLLIYTMASKLLSVNDIIDKEIKKERKKEKVVKDKVSTEYIPVNYTQDEINDMLTDFLLIKPDEIYHISLGSHIRYFKKDGLFMAGGYLKRKWKKEENIYFQISKSPYNSNRMWVVDLNKIDRIYKKVNEDSMLEINRIRDSLIGLNSKIKKLEEKIDEIQEELNNIKEESKINRESSKNTKKTLYDLVKYISSKKN